ncbi:sigma-70 family RNA polymerase sigma factor [Frankia sp. Cj3]|uniref:sigma-70 family RNA polymerase sigma factor n=1 Tax=Frankia sp. Cj3 TaxID=2880976 RepID=UPI001EF6891B|nr:sigma-70 family RNA polymerase sigma factor [Frankia sp. Cj3]
MLGPPGSEKARAAAQFAAEYNTAEIDTTVVVPGRVLKHYVGAIAPYLGRDAVVTFHEFMPSLWRKLYGRSPPELERWRYDFDSCLGQVLRERPRTLWTRRPIILDGERYPAEFYSLLRMLSIPATVLADENYPMGEDGSTAPDIRSALGTSEPLMLTRNNRTTRPVAAFANSFYSGSRSGRCVVPERDGPRPVLLSTPTFSSFVDWLVDFERLRPARSIGVLVRAAGLVARLENALSGRTLNRRRCYESSRPDLARSLDFGSPGITILVWQSARSVEFDSVVLAELQDVSDPSRDLASQMNLHVLSARARTELVLTYSGSGAPSFVDALPTELIDDVRGCSVMLPPSVETLSDRDCDGTNYPSIFTGIVPEHPGGGERRARQVQVARRLVDGERHRGRASRRVLTADEEVGLAILIRADGTSLSEEVPQGYRSTLENSDQRAVAFDLLLLHNIGLVRSIARTFVVSGLDMEDLVQGGVFGLVRAIEKFDASLGHKFSTYASTWIRQSIGRTIDNDSRLIRLPVQMAERIRKVQAAYAAASVDGTGVDLNEVRRRTELTSKQVVDALRLARGIVSLDRPVEPGADSTLGDLLDGAADFDSDPAVVIDRKLSAVIVADVLDQMNPREARILRLRNGFEVDEPWTLEMVGAKFGVTRERIRQIEVKAKQNFRSLLASAETQAQVQAQVGGGPPVRATRSRSVREGPRAKDARQRAVDSVRPPWSPTTGNRRWQTVAQGTELPAALRRDHGHTALAELVVGCIDYAVSAGGTRVSLDFDLTARVRWIDLRVDGSAPSTWNIHPAVAAAGASAPSNPPSAVGLTQLMLSVADQITISTRAPSGRSTHVSLVLARMTGHWWLRVIGDDIPAESEPSAPSGATHVAVQMRGLRPTWLGGDVSPTVAAVAARTLRATIGLVYGVVIADGTLTIEIADEKVVARDPFATGNPATQDLGTEYLRHDGHRVEVTPYVIPHPDRLSVEESSDLGDLVEMQRRQGFYVRCDGRLIATGGWFGLPGLGADKETALSRVLIEIDSAERPAWQDEATGTTQLPESLRARLRDLAMAARQRSTEVFRYRRASRAVTEGGVDG